MTVTPQALVASLALEQTRESYDRIAEEYAERIYGELAHKPFDREWLDRFAARVKRLGGPACDMGCGPGQIARYLTDKGVPGIGVDLSPGMIETAQRLNPGIEFVAGNMLALDAPDGAWSGIAAFYSLCHIPPEQQPQVLAEFRRALVPGGWLLLAFHIGDEVIHSDELWGKTVNLDFIFLRTEDVTRRLRETGFEVHESAEREPYAPEVEHQSRRAYIMARKPPGS